MHAKYYYLSGLLTFVVAVNLFKFYWSFKIVTPTLLGSYDELITDWNVCSRTLYDFPICETPRRPGVCYEITSCNTISFRGTFEYKISSYSYQTCWIFQTPILNKFTGCRLDQERYESDLYWPISIKSSGFEFLAMFTMFFLFFITTLLCCCGCLRQCRRHQVPDIEQPLMSPAILV
jgi:hypothetical protein